MKIINFILLALFLEQAPTEKPVEDYDIDTEINICDDIQTKFCDGWEEGYCEGWQSIQGQLAMCPIAPICPIPEVLENEYNDGYNRGFLKGRVDAKR